jgi:cyanophycinase
VISLFLGSLALLGATESAVPFTIWRKGADRDTVPSQPPRNALLLAGGGGDVIKAWRSWLGAAAGGDVVVLRTSGGDGYQDFIYRELGGVASVTTLRLDRAEAAHAPEVLRRVAEAEAVFLAGGDQARYIREWAESPLGTALQAHVDAGKPIGGTSAGLAVLGEWAFAALQDTITTEEARKNPLDARITLTPGLVRHPWMRGVMTDSHFSERDRLGRLCIFLQRLPFRTEGPWRGLGIDEATAIVVEGEGRGRVYSEREGSAWAVELVNVEHHPEMRIQPVRVQRLAAGETVNFPDLFENPSAREPALLYDVKTATTRTVSASAKESDEAGP